MSSFSFESREAYVALQQNKSVKPVQRDEHCSIREEELK